MSLTEHNNETRDIILAMVQDMGVSGVAKLMDVNHYYISQTIKNPNYIPRNVEIATKLGYKVYRTSVPHGTPRKKQKRCTIYPNTDPKKIIRMLRDVTGIEWLPMIDEMEY